jgi:pimeloyl-ACP methyl ester carboxylesterase
MVHGINTPAIGLFPLAKRLQELEKDTHIVLFDLWGDGLSSTPIAPHAPSIFHFQILQILSYLGWARAEIVGYSVGASLAVNFTLSSPWVPLSVTLLAPAGLLRFKSFSQEMQDLLLDSTDTREKEAMDCVFNYLEDGPLIVPSDWKERTSKGEVVAEAVRDFLMKEHAGYRHSVLSAFREGGVYGRDEMFSEFSKLPVKKFVVLGELDGVCTKEQLLDLGFEDVEVIPGEGHNFPRTSAVSAADILHRFWTKYR